MPLAQFIIRVDKDLYRRFKAKCITRGISMKKVMTYFMEAYLEEEQIGQGKGENPKEQSD